MADKKPNPTISLKSSIRELVRVALSERQSKAIARFDFGNDREVAVCVFVEDAAGYLTVVQAYEDGRDRYANLVANAVAAHIEKNGLPDKDNPQPFNIIHSSDGEEENDA